MVRPGVTTAQIDKAVHDFIVSQGARPTFLNYGGFPASACISVNDVVIHGIPGSRVLKEGDIVSVDVGAMWNGFTGDCAGTFPCGKISPEAQRLIDVTRRSFFEGVKFARQGCRVSDIGHAVQTYVEANGFSVVRSFVGHGVGANLHEEPEVPNFGTPGRGPRLSHEWFVAHGRSESAAVSAMHPVSPVRMRTASIAQSHLVWTDDIAHLNRRLLPVLQDVNGHEIRLRGPLAQADLADNLLLAALSLRWTNHQHFMRRKRAIALRADELVKRRIVELDDGIQPLIVNS